MPKDNVIRKKWTDFCDAVRPPLHFGLQPKKMSHFDPLACNTPENLKEQFENFEKFHLFSGKGVYVLLKI